MKFAELEILLAAVGFISEANRFDRIIVEGYRCRYCGGALTYEGFSCGRKQLAFGICRKCGACRPFLYGFGETVAGRWRFSTVGKRKKPVLETPANHI